MNLRAPFLVVLLVGCGRVAPSGTARTELTRSAWRFHFLTAAHCNDWSRTLGFSTDGGMTSRLERSVLTQNECSIATTTDRGSWSADERQVTVTLGSTAWRAQLDTTPAPRLNLAAGTIATTPPSLTTRAFRRRDDAWVEEHETTTDGRRVWTKTSVSASGGSACALRVTVEVDVEGVKATETFSPPCTRLDDAQSGWHAFGHLERFNYRFDAVRAAGVFERQPTAVANAIVDGLVLALVVNDANDQLAVHPASSDESLGWYDAVP